jgi:hypothetical protein
MLRLGIVARNRLRSENSVLDRGSLPSRSKTISTRQALELYRVPVEDSEMYNDSRALEILLDGFHLKFYSLVPLAAAEAITVQSLDEAAVAELVSIN